MEKKIISISTQKKSTDETSRDEGAVLLDGYSRLTNEQRAEITGMARALLYCQEEEKIQSNTSRSRKSRDESKHLKD